MFTLTCDTFYSIILHFKCARASYLNQLQAFTGPIRGPVTYSCKSPVWQLSTNNLETVRNGFI